MAQRAAPTDLTILIQGESGTGKEVAGAGHPPAERAQGRAVHPRQLPPRSPKGCSSPSCSATSAAPSRARSGRGPAASSWPSEGTLFLDEIGDMPLAMQAKILRALQERQIERVGGVKAIGVDVRIIAATHQNLEELVADGQVPPGSLLPAAGREARACPRSASASTTCRCSSPTCSSGRRSGCGARPPPCRRRRCAACGPTRGRAMSASCSTCSKAAMVLSDGVILPEHLPPADPARRPSVRAAGGGPIARRWAARSTRRSRSGERRMILDALQQGQRRAGAGGQDPRHLRAQPLVPGQEAQDPGAPGGRGVAALSSAAEAVSALLATRHTPRWPRWGAPGPRSSSSSPPWPARRPRLPRGAARDRPAAPAARGRLRLPRQARSGPARSAR